MWLLVVIAGWTVLFGVAAREEIVDVVRTVLRGGGSR